MLESSKTMNCLKLGEPPQRVATPSIVGPTAFWSSGSVSALLPGFTPFLQPTHQRTSDSRSGRSV